jgi:hypothetical protein
VDVGSEHAALAYVAKSDAQIVNVSMLGARLLYRVGTSIAKSFERERMLEQAGRLARFGISQQLADGTWRYAVGARGAWTDSYHTGFILESLLCLRALQFDVPGETVSSGLRAYAQFFDDDGGARYSRDKRAPYDAHSAAQGVVTYSTLAKDASASASERASALNQAERIVDWCLDHLWIRDKEHFAHRINDGVRDEQEYVRWVQAWMALALGTILAVRERTEGLATQAAR